MKERKSPDEKQSYLTQIRLKKEEREFLLEQASFGFRSISDQIRMMMSQWREDRGFTGEKK